MENSERCKEKVWEGFHSHRCLRKAVKDGYCTQHHPDSVAKRRAKSEERYQAQLENSPYHKIGKLQKENKELTEALKGLVYAIANSDPGSKHRHEAFLFAEETLEKFRRE